MKNQILSSTLAYPILLFGVGQDEISESTNFIPLTESEIKVNHLNPEYPNSENIEYSSNKHSNSSLYDTVESKLLGFDLLNEDWDGYGGYPPENNVLILSKNILKSLKHFRIHPPQVMLSGTGEIGFFWDDDTTYIEISIEKSNHYAFLIKRNEDILGEDKVLFEDNKLNNILLKELNQI